MTDEMSGLNKNNFLAERVRQQLEVFPRRFRELGEAGELRDLFRDTHTLYGPRIHQSPEDFTEQYLIEPVLHGLGYLNPISEDYTGEGPHFVRRPSTFPAVENKRPDYKLENISPRTVCILEAKAANAEQPRGSKRNATENIEDYVSSNTFATYLESRERRYLVAVGTDGLRWVLWAKDVRSRDTREAIKEVDLAPIVESIAQQNTTIEGSPDFHSPEIRNTLANEFVPAFSAPCIDGFVRNQFE
jgi:hypothetical protein